MAIRHWLRKALADSASDGDVPSEGRLLRSLFGRDAPQLHALGEYDAESYPEEMEQRLRRRQEVAERLIEMELTDRQRRIDAIPELKELLQKYPHPLAYETLIMAYLDAGKYDEARGVAFAARERRIECERSPHPEIRAETDRLREWSPDDVDAVRAEREGASAG
jgi:tetratricopeptide (TPR) repeat protein